MEYRKLGNSGLNISAIGLGGNTFSWGVDEKTSAAIINRAVELGVNYIDTADMYARGGSEEFVGKAIRGKRYELVIATKFGRKMGEGPNDKGGSRYYIMRAVEASLKRLQTDYIDLYQIHEPDSMTHIEETLRALDDLVRAGKVRYIGTSNFAAWQICEALYISKMNSLHSFITEQPRYNILDRSIEAELVPFCRAHNIGIIPWGPLAGGFLTGKYRKGKKPVPGWRLTSGVRLYGELFTDANWNKLAKLEKFAKERGHTVGELAIAWLLAKPWVTTIIAGAREVKQVTANVAAGKWQLTAEEVVALDAISAGE
ncbi:MAG: aldo/keto reductase [Chloroflexi bacterium RBG_16_50_9]|nr:MAG: aldo/keto reductase [Chloroflexi bacterium RBG_16_50_9]